MMQTKKDKILKLGADFFTHDTDASSDEKIIYLESKHGDTGYALFFKFLEVFARSENTEIFLKDASYLIYAKKFNHTVEKIKEFICDAVYIGAFTLEEQDQKLFSKGLKKRLQPLFDTRIKNKEKQQRFREKQGLLRNGNVTVTESLENGNVTVTLPVYDEIQTDSKVKYSKVKESKEEESISNMVGNNKNGENIQAVPDLIGSISYSQSQYDQFEKAWSEYQGIKKGDCLKEFQGFISSTQDWRTVLPKLFDAVINENAYIQNERRLYPDRQFKAFCNWLKSRGWENTKEVVQSLKDMTEEEREKAISRFIQ